MFKSLLRSFAILLFDRTRTEDELPLEEAQNLAAEVPDLKRRNKKLHDDLIEVLEAMEASEDARRALPPKSARKKAAPKKKGLKK